MTHVSSLVILQEKFASRNPISRLLLRNYFKRLIAAISAVEFETMLEVGSGEGVLLANIGPHLGFKNIYASDIDQEWVATARRNFPPVHASAADAYGLPFADDQFDLVICCEVLEHLADPRRAFQEMQRVTRKYGIMTVPDEPAWRVLNLLRGSYVRDLGNTPGHVNHWGSKSFRALASEYFDVAGVLHAFPWTGVVCLKSQRSN